MKYTAYEKGNFSVANKILDRMAQVNPLGAPPSAASLHAPLQYGLLPEKSASFFSDLWLRLLPSPSTATPFFAGDGDWELLARLYGGWRANEPSFSIANPPPPIRVWGPVAEDTLPTLAQSERLVRLYAAHQEPHPDCRISIDEQAEPWKLALAIQSTPDTVTFNAVLCRGNPPHQRLPLAEQTSVHFSADGWFLHANTLSRYSLEHTSWLRLLEQSGWSIDVPQSEWLPFFKQLPPDWPLPPLLDTENISWRIIQNSSPVPVLTISRTNTLYSGELFFDYGGTSIIPVSHAHVVEVRNSHGHIAGIVVRNLPAENTLRSTLDRLGWTKSPSPAAWTLSVHQAPSVIEKLVAEGWRIIVDNDAKATPVVVKDWTCGAGGIDWFDLLNVTWGDGPDRISANVLELLRCIENKSCFAQIPGQGTVLITDELAHFLSTAKAYGKVNENGIQLEPQLAALLLAKDPNDSSPQPKANSIPAFLLPNSDDAMSDFFGKIAPYDPPPTFKGELRPYQKVGLGWLRFLRNCGFGGCLADDMGLGKTVQVIALLDEVHAAADGAGNSPKRPTLIVAPLTLLNNWYNELRRFAPNLRVHIHHGTGRYAMAQHFHGFDVIVTTYGMVNSDNAWLSKIPFEYVVLDEAHQIRNADSKVSAAVKKLSCRHRLALTGTPIINYARDLKSLFDFLSPGLLHAVPHLKPILMAGSSINENNARLVGKMLRPFILRRTKGEVLQDLPPKTETTLYCELSEEDWTEYVGVRNAYRQQLLQNIGVYGMNSQRMHVLTALMRLRQLACHRGMIDSSRQSGTSSKLAFLLEELEQVLAEGHKVIVFSQFVTFLHIIRSHLETAGRASQISYLDGSSAHRGSIVDDFQTNPDKRIFLVSIKAGGVGLNLTAADYVYVADPWWNSAIENQAIDRTHRIGQDRPVFAYRLIARNTIEEKVMQLQERKNALVDAILNDNNPNIEKLTTDDVEFLFS